MKKLLALLVVIALSAGNVALIAQDGVDEATYSLTEATSDVDSNATTLTDATPISAADDNPEEAEMVEPTIEVEGADALIKRYYIEGDPFFMTFVLICLILGLAMCIERIIYLNMATTNTGRLLRRVEEAMASDGIEGAKEVCRGTRGPVASIFYQALDRSGGSAADVEKAIGDYGAIEMARMERGLSWISLFIAIAPMLGFMGTVIGMIGAFDDIQNAGAMSPQIVAGGIKVALLTPVSGLIVAIILQIFYNYILSKIDSIVLEMEDSSISMVDMVIRQEVMNK